MSYHWNWSILLAQTPSGESTYLGWLMSGLVTTAALSLSAWVIALAVGGVMGVLRTVPSRGWRAIAACYVELFRNTPLLVQLFLWYFVLPEVLPARLGEAYKSLHPMLQQFSAALICLGLFTGARVCEQVRAGIESLARGQGPAGLALGLSLAQTYRHVLLPQAARIVVPPLSSEFVNVFKNSAVASTIGLLDLAAQGRQLLDYTAQPYESFIAVTLAFVLLNLVVLRLMRGLEAKTRLPAGTAALG